MSTAPDDLVDADTARKAALPPSSRPPSSALGATAILKAFGPSCPVCHKTNHPGVGACVFCGSVLAEDALTPTRSGFSERPPEGAPSPSAPPRQATDAPLWTAPAPSPAPSSSGGPSSIGPGLRALSLESSSDELSAKAHADPLIGVVVADRYRILEPLGRGGMGAVYKVEHVRIGKFLAMKLLTGELSQNPAVVRRFKREALTVSKLSSLNTVQVFDFGAAEGLTYLVMELVAGDNLGRVLRNEGPMPFPRLGKIVIQVCNSLAEAHSKGIVHRDIKPENLMLVSARDGTDVAKVLDFGLAKLRESEGLSDVTSQGAIVGTPYFMAPEQIRGEAVDARADIYALGALMYRALTGHNPFNGPTPLVVFAKHLNDPPVPLRERAPDLDIPRGADALVMKALRKSPNARFQKIDELKAALLEELRAQGRASVELLLDSGHLGHLTKDAPPAEGAARQGGAAEIATRNEVEAYERKLRRQRFVALGIALGIALATACGAARLAYYHLREARAFEGVEIEPNDTAKEATRIPLGRRVSGQLGKRLDPTHGDRDFYTFEVPAHGTDSAIALELSALPNFPMCTLLYKQGFETALGQYCVGRPGRALSIRALRLDPGRYLVTVMQDLDPHGGPLPFVHENVSDWYTLVARTVAIDPAHEVEPNDQVATAETLVPEGVVNPPGTSGSPASLQRASVSAAIGWLLDADVFCVSAGIPGKIRWKVRDTTRDAGVLRIALMRSSEEGAPVHLHTMSGGKISTSDVTSPWHSPAIEPQDALPRCLKVSLEAFPSSNERSGMLPSGGSEPYVVEVQAVP